MSELAAFSLQVRKVVENYDSAAEYVFYDNDLDTIQWVKFEKPVMAKAQIESALVELEKAEAEAAKARAENRSALLERLGITEEEAKLLLS